MKAFKSISGLLCLTALTLGSVTARAAVFGPLASAPGGNTFSVSGAASAGDSGGQTFHYSGFNPSNFSSLYWGPSSIFLPTATLDGTPGRLQFSGFTGNVAVWNASAVWHYPTWENNWINQVVQLKLEILNPNLGPIPSWKLFSQVNGTDPLGVGAVLDNSAGVDFSVRVAFFAATNLTGYVPLNEVPQNPVCGEPCTQSSFTPAFYSTTPPDPVPVPAAVWLFGSAVGLFAAIRRKFGT